MTAAGLDGAGMAARRRASQCFGLIAQEASGAGAACFWMNSATAVESSPCQPS